MLERSCKVTSGEKTSVSKPSRRGGVEEERPVAPCMILSYSPQEPTVCTKRWTNLPSSIPRPTFCFLAETGTKSEFHTVRVSVPESLSPTAAFLTMASVRMGVRDLMNCRQERNGIS